MVGMESQVSEGREYELKFTIAQADIEHLIAHPLLKPTLHERRVTRLVSTYFDTPDASLRAARISLRTRLSDQGSSQTLKRAGASFVDRDEWETEDDGARPNLAWLRRTPLAAFFEAPVGEALDARFTVDVMRTTLALRHGDATIEGALDQGAIRADGRALPVNEFELELKGGSSDAVVAMARKLARDVPLVLSLASKAERGYGIVDLSWGCPTKTIPLLLEPGMSNATAFSAIVQGCLHALLVNAALIGVGNRDAEAVHATRIALRRLRAALDLFGPILRRKAASAIRRDVKWLADRLGAARDADVFAAELEARAADETLPGAGALASVTRDPHDAAYDALREALASPRFRLLVLDLAAFSAAGLRRRRSGKPFAPFARRRLAKRRNALIRPRRRPSQLSTHELHDLRKDAKMLRYDLEFLDGMASGRERKRVVKLHDALSRLQQSLGIIHDQDALRAFLRDTIVPRGAPAGVTSADWKRARDAAEAIARSPTDRRRPLRSAMKAARVVARTDAFRR